MALPTKIFSSIDQAEELLPLAQPKKLVLNGRPFCIIRTNSGIFVTENFCPHSRASLNEGTVNAFDELICPLHEYRFDLVTGREFSQRCDDLPTYEVQVLEDGVFLMI